MNENKKKAKISKIIEYYHLNIEKHVKNYCKSRKKVAIISCKKYLTRKQFYK